MSVSAAEASAAGSVDALPEDVQRYVSRRFFLQRAGGIAAYGAVSLAFADQSWREFWYNSIGGEHPSIESIYEVNRSAIPTKHVLLIDGTGTNNTFNAEALAPNVGQNAQVHGFMHSTRGIDRPDIARRIHDYIHRFDYVDDEPGPLSWFRQTPSRQGIHREVFHDLVLVGCSEGANEVCAIANELIATPAYQNTHICGLILRDPTFGDASIKGFSRLAARGMNAASFAFERSGPIAYYLGEMAHVAMDTPLYKTPAEAWRRTSASFRPLGSNTVSEQGKMIQNFPGLLPHYAEALGGIPTRIVLGELDPLIDGKYASSGIQAVLPDAKIDVLLGAEHGSFYSVNDRARTKTYIQQCAILQEIFREIGWPAVWDTERQEPFTPPVPQRHRAQLIDKN